MSVKQIGSGWDAKLLDVSSGSKLFANDRKCNLWAIKGLIEYCVTIFWNCLDYTIPLNGHGEGIRLEISKLAFDESSIETNVCSTGGLKRICQIWKYKSLKLCCVSFYSQFKGNWKKTEILPAHTVHTSDLRNVCAGNISAFFSNTFGIDKVPAKYLILGKMITKMPILGEKFVKLYTLDKRLSEWKRELQTNKRTQARFICTSDLTILYSVPLHTATSGHYCSSIFIKKIKSLWHNP